MAAIAVAVSMTLAASACGSSTPAVSAPTPAPAATAAPTSSNAEPATPDSSEDDTEAPTPDSSEVDTEAPTPNTGEDDTEAPTPNASEDDTEDRTPDGDDDQREVIDACLYAPDDATCGVLEVPENYDQPSGATVLLPYVILPALGPSPAAEPLVYLQGGPGASTISSVAEFATFDELREDRDLIFLEQRGTGLSEPFLGCADQGGDELAALAACYDGFVAEGVDPSQYTTATAATDLLTLRTELGIEQWHLLGISYGTTLALISMRIDPEGTASVILDSPTAPDVIIYNADVESMLNLVSRIIDQCEADVDCNERYPDLFATHLATLDELAVEPWIVGDPALVSLFEGESVDVDLHQAIVLELSGKDPGSVPGYITGVAARDEAALLEVAPLGWGTGTSDAADGDAADSAGANAITACVTDPGCSADYPTIEDDFENLLADLDDSPLVITNPDLIDLLDLEAVSAVDFGFLASELFDLTSRADLVAGLVTVFTSRDEDEIFAYVSEMSTIIDGTPPDSSTAGEFPIEREDAFGYTLSVYCAEETPFFDLEATPLQTLDDWPEAITQPMFPPVDEFCGVWDVAPADAADVAQVVSDIPTLIMAGQYDDLTPLRQGEIAAAGLSRSELIEVPSLGHGLIGNACVRDIMADFLRAPGGSRDCLDEIATVEIR